MRILIVTWITYENYGTFLQAFALQNILNELGYENMIADDSEIIKTFAIKNKPRSIIFRALIYIINFFDFRRMKYIKIQKNISKKFDYFRNSFLKIDTDTSDLNDLGEKYDAYICGSDQIWYPSDSIFNPYFYLSFTDKKKIAYAPSIGTSKYPDSYVKRVKPLLKKFNHISVREEQGAQILAKILNKPVETVLDPTLLLSSEKWRDLADKQEVKSQKAYAICYFLTPNKIYMDAAKKYAREKDLKLKVFCTNKEFLSYADKSLACGPFEFLSEIKKSEIVFTDSFHATIFAMHFEKDFYTFKRFKDDQNNNQNSRLINLFSITSLENRFISEKEINNIGYVKDIDFFDLKQRINIYKDKSLDYLQNALNN